MLRPVQRLRCSSPARPHRASWLRATAARAAFSAVILTASAGFYGCTEHAPARFATAPSLPEQERRADGVAVDMASDPPPFQYASGSEQMVVTLKAPLSERAARNLLNAFFEAVAQENISGLAALTASGARVHDLRAGKHDGIHNITSLWRERFSKHSYELLPASTVYRDNAVGRYESGDVERLPIAVRYSMGREIGQREVLLRVPIATPTIGNERLFGDEIYFLLRERDNRHAGSTEREDSYVITAMAEQIPF